MTNAAANPQVRMQTSMGDITIELFPDKAPATVSNFLAYVDAGFYSGTIFHRVIDGFMIQGGGFDAKFQQKPTRETVKNEAANGLKNTRGTLAMARTSDPDSASAQFFINVNDNEFLNFKSPDPQGIGYCVFGRVVGGMDVVDKMKAVPTGTMGMYRDVPSQTMEIKSATRAGAAQK